ncbi:MAG: ATP-binding protein [Candidatus Nitrosocaldus sp.]
MDELFGRGQEIKELLALVRAGRWVAILGPRMVGKTSLVKAASSELKMVGIKTIYINLWGVRGAQGLLDALAQGLNQEKSILKRIKNIAKHIEGISLGVEGISISLARRPMKTIWDLLAIIGEQGDCVIAFDEVQELSPISNHLLRLLANIFNTYPKIVFILTGSMFGLMKALLEPRSTSPLYGRSPARLYLQPFTREKAIEFLRHGFNEYNRSIRDREVNEAVDRLDGIPGWLTLYGNNVAVRGMPHGRALEETIAEGTKIVKDELEHFLQGRDRMVYITALKAMAISARWGEIKNAIEIRRGYSVNDATIYNIIESLKAAMLIGEDEGIYTVKDPMLRALLLTL